MVYAAAVHASLLAVVFSLSESHLPCACAAWRVPPTGGNARSCSSLAVVSLSESHLPYACAAWRVPPTGGNARSCWVGSQLRSARCLKTHMHRPRWLEVQRALLPCLPTTTTISTAALCRAAASSCRMFPLCPPGSRVPLAGLKWCARYCIDTAPVLYTPASCNFHKSSCGGVEVHTLLQSTLCLHKSCIFTRALWGAEVVHTNTAIDTVPP